MTRRDLIGTLASAVITSATAQRVQVPVHRIVDARLHSPDRLRRFQSKIWPEAVRDFSRGGIDLQITDGPGEVKFTAADRPILLGLQRHAINLVVTDRIPMYWDGGRAWAGVTTLYEGYHVCMIALRYAHGDQVAFVSVNTCVHEILHALMQDIFLKSPKWYQAGGREFRIDWYATRMWMFHEGDAVRASASGYLERLRK